MIDPKTVYLRMPPTFMESETCLMTMRNLMRQANERRVKEQEKAMPALPQAGDRGAEPSPGPPSARFAPVRLEELRGEGLPAELEGDGKAIAKTSPKAKPSASGKPSKSTAADMAKLVSLRDQGILTEEEFIAARRRLFAAS